MSYAGKNLRYLRKLRGWTQEEFANKLKIKRSLIGAYEEERAEPRLDVLENLCSIFKLTLDELLLKDLAASKGNNYLEKRRQLKMASEAQVIQFVPVKAAAGYLAGYADPEFVDELNTFTLPMLAPGNYRAFEIVGDSMLPTPSGSVIVGEKIENVDEVLEIWKVGIVIPKGNTQQRWDVNQLAGLVSNLQDQVSSFKRKMN